MVLSPGIEMRNQDRFVRPGWDEVRLGRRGWVGLGWGSVGARSVKARWGKVRLGLLVKRLG